MYGRRLTGRGKGARVGNWRNATGCRLGAGAALALGVAIGSVLSANPDALEALPRARRVQAVVVPGVEGVALDQRIEIRFSRTVRQAAVGPESVTIAPSAGAAANGHYVVGKLLFDKAQNRQVVVRPEAVEEYYRLVERLPREQAVRRARRLLRRVERTGRTRLLDPVERGLREVFGASSGPRVRLDQSFAGVASEAAMFPPQVALRNPLAAYRRIVAGDDALWEAHRRGETGAYEFLSADPERDRFHHPVDAETGTRSEQSVLRGYAYRRVLVDRRSKRVVTFLPRLPQKPALVLDGLLPATEYRVRVRGTKGVVGRFTTRTAPVDGESAYLDTDWPEVGPTQLAPRIINVTPPDGERLVVPTTDWEDPDHLLQTPVGDRRAFRVRLRLDVPVDPRSLEPGIIRLRKVAKFATGDPLPIDPPVPIHATIGLEQSRLGKVEVSITPSVVLDPDGIYEVSVDERARALYGGGLRRGFASTFATAPGPVDTRPIVEEFGDAGLRASGDAFWPAPAELDPEGLGLAVAAGTDGGASSSVTSAWIDLGHDSLVLRAAFDDPATPAVEGTRVLLPAAGGSARILVRGAYQDLGLEPGSPDLNSQSPWWPLDALDRIRDRRMVQFRIEFTLPDGWQPGDPRPAVDRLEIGLSTR